MKTNLPLALSALGCLALASCYPLPDRPPRQTAEDLPEKKSVTSQDQQKIQEQHDRMKQRETPAQQTASTPREEPRTQPPANRPPAQPPRQDFAFANPVPGKEGFVFSPYNNKVVDVRDIPSGTLVQDPTYPAEEKKYFRVP